MKVVVTGAAGFLGWHTRARLSTLASVGTVVGIDRTAFATAALEDAVADADVVLHIAGINRASQEEVREGNIALAERLVEAMTRTGSRARIVVAGSLQADGTGPDETPYGVGKRVAAERLAAFAEEQGSSCVEVRLPNLYGEHGRPEYNSFVATFAHRIAAGQTPQVTGDREIPLLHVQDAVADLLAAAFEADPPVLLRPTAVVPLRISWVADRLASFHDCYRVGQIPTLTDAVDVRLFNVLRAAMWDQGVRSFPLTAHTDARGSFVEILRQHGGAGQSSFSTTVPGVTRGDHLHFRKIERFVVVRGRGVIRLRKVLTDEVVEIPVGGDAPVAVDMPTLWTHSITNTGDEEMLTLFWINEMYDPADADTYPEKVLPSQVTGMASREGEQS
ncbi:UDP-2-acetamido-2,6-beta-L-arabino-hexul-4-ose reductase [Austwickia chelonae]|uniref:Putative NAD-dependent epimerase/dehydratase n=1 Tax=Austwickia chelonae NBRC 105200 TaxID=1184607 RepID=K6VMZ6_9MICO|nr:NAD-dependent epimerase/dehydratase family protein [Austwickia chelonae]GAB76750.1 putative NAD-dependent epimerase/dehydratase [Austwickia chelonae NBRC 105200]SEW30156.1 UDP-2-acetamido-2,6-beta-L-arabino-hexul-4-ose reductase [Austwickia chelonae]